MPLSPDVEAYSKSKKAAIERLSAPNRKLYEEGDSAIRNRVMTEGVRDAHKFIPAMGQPGYKAGVKMDFTKNYEDALRNQGFTEAASAWARREPDPFGRGAPRGTPPAVPTGGSTIPNTGMFGGGIPAFSRGVPPPGSAAPGTVPREEGVKKIQEEIDRTAFKLFSEMALREPRIAADPIVAQKYMQEQRKIAEEMVLSRLNPATRAVYERHPRREEPADEPSLRRAGEETLKRFNEEAAGRFERAEEARKLNEEAARRKAAEEGGPSFTERAQTARTRREREAAGSNPFGRRAPRGAPPAAPPEGPTIPNTGMFGGGIPAFSRGPGPSGDVPPEARTFPGTARGAASPPIPPEAPAADTHAERMKKMQEERKAAQDFYSNEFGTPEQQAAFRARLATNLEARNRRRQDIPSLGANAPRGQSPRMASYSIPESSSFFPSPSPEYSLGGLPPIPEIPQGRTGVLPTAPTGHQINPEMASVHTPLVQGAADLNQAIRNRAVFDSNQPFQPYPAERLVAPRNALYDKAFRQMEGSSASHLPYLRRAEDIARPAETPSYDQEMMRKYQDPYEQQIINKIEQDAARNLRESILPQLNAQFVRMGQHGSARHQELANKAAAELNRMVSERTTEERQKGYREAQRSREIDAARQLEMARLYGTMGQTAQAQNMTGAQATMAEADRRRQHIQDILNAEHNQWEQGRDWSQRGTNALIGAAAGIPGELGRTTTYARPVRESMNAPAWGNLALAAAPRIISALPSFFSGARSNGGWQNPNSTRARFGFPGL